MPLQFYTTTGAEPQANEPVQAEPQVEQIAVPPSYPEITSINQIFRFEEVINLTIQNDNPETRLAYVFIASIIGESNDHIRQHHQLLTNRRFDSFLEKSVDFLTNVTQFDELVQIMYGDWTPPQAIIDEHIANVRRRLNLARDALMANDPQFCISLLHNHKIKYEQLPTWINDNLGHAVDEQDTFGVDATTTPQTPFILLDSAFHPERFLCTPTRINDRVTLSLTTRRQNPDGFNEEIPHELLTGETNLQARVRDMFTQESRVTRDINNITAATAGQTSLSDLHNRLIHYIDLWKTRDNNENFRHPDLPAPRIIGSIHYHRTATPHQVMTCLSARCKKVRRAHAAVGKVLPQRISDFIVEFPADEGMGSMLLNEEDLRVFVALVD